MVEHTNKAVLVTGAARRIGRVIALHLASRGWDVVVHYHRSKDDAESTVNEIIALGRRAVAVSCDLSDAAQVTQLIGRANSQLGPLDCVVNNASLFEFDDPKCLNEESLRPHMQTNLLAPILLAQSLVGQLREGQQGVVVNLLDQKLFNLNPDYLSYTLSKSALATATHLLAQSLAPRLRVVGVAPGITLPSGPQSQEEYAQASQMTPLGYSSSAEDVAAAVCFAIENRSITGTTILVDGGQHLLPSPRDVMFMLPRSGNKNVE